MCTPKLSTLATQNAERLFLVADSSTVQKFKLRHSSNGKRTGRGPGFLLGASTTFSGFAQQIILRYGTSTLTLHRLKPLHTSSLLSR
jgi:hypothetical protein